MFWEETIAAVSTPPGTGGIGVIRISGPEAVLVADRVFHAADGRRLSQCESHTIHYGSIKDPVTGEMLDEVLVMLMRAPRTFTKEDVVELDCHGGSYLLHKVLQVVLKQGARLAEPGEFTKRAFLNGRIDLSQAESVMDMIGAQTEMALTAAARRLRGQLGEKIQKYRRQIMDLLVLLEVEIDYPEYEIEEVQQTDMKEALYSLQKELENLYETADTGRMLNEGIRIVLAGRPNMGKSTLLNALLGENRAIVTEIPGTTRDTLEESVNLCGIPIRLIDTAGIRDTVDIVEKMGVERARQAIEESDLVLLLLEASVEPSEEDKELLHQVKDRPYLIIRTKKDQGEKITGFGDPDKTIVLSAYTGEGVEILKKRIRDMVLKGSLQSSDGIFLANNRQQEAVRKAAESIRSATLTLENEMGTDLVSMDLNAAYDLLGELTGNSVREDLIDTIFSRFCLGK